MSKIEVNLDDVVDAINGLTEELYILRRDEVIISCLQSITTSLEEISTSLEKIADK